jgi:hypothetical protein
LESHKLFLSGFASFAIAFPLAYFGTFGTFGAAATFFGINKINSAKI